MSIHLYTLCWNDAEMLPFMFRHYDDFVKKLTLYLMMARPTDRLKY